MRASTPSLSSSSSKVIYLRLTLINEKTTVRGRYLIFGISIRLVPSSRFLPDISMKYNISKDQRARVEYHMKQLKLAYLPAAISREALSSRSASCKRNDSTVNSRRFPSSAAPGDWSACLFCLPARSRGYRPGPSVTDIIRSSSDLSATLKHDARSRETQNSRGHHY